MTEALRFNSLISEQVLPMELDDELCLCFHVTKRKVTNFIKREKPVRASQLSECFGAGTGCGWCRPFLQRLWEKSQQDGTLLDSPANREFNSADTAEETAAQ